MKKYNFYYNHTPITRGQFEKAVPKDWENEMDDYGSYSHGYYRAEEREEPRNQDWRNGTKK